MKAKAFFVLPFLLLLLLSACEEDDLSTVSFEDSKLRYHRSVTRMEANKLGRYLSEKGFFQRGKAQEVIISKQDYEYEVLWEVDRDFVPHPEILSYFYDLRDSLQQQVHEKNTLRMELFSNGNRYERWEMRDKIPPYFQTEKHVIYYKESVELPLVQQFGEALDQADFLNPDGEVFMLENDKSSIFLGLASGIRRSNEFKSRFSELRSNMLQVINKDARLIFEIRDPMLDAIEESISAPFYPNSTSANGIRIKYDESISRDDIRILRDFIQFKRMQSPEWIVFIQTDEGEGDRYKLIIPVDDINNLEEIEIAKNFARAMSPRLRNSYIDVELLDEKNDNKKLIKAESL